MSERVAEKFMLDAIQEWGQPERTRVAAVQTLLDAVGFKATATCWPIFGGIWPRPCEGEQADAATAWLKDLTSHLPRGKFETEVAYLRAEIAACAKQNGKE